MDETIKTLHSFHGIWHSHVLYHRESCVFGKFHCVHKLLKRASWLVLKFLFFYLFQPWKWNEIPSNLIPIELIWSAVMPISGIFHANYPNDKFKYSIILMKTKPPFFPVFILIFTEAYDQKIKSNRYYYCATFFIYESIAILSILTFIYTMMHRVFIEKYTKDLQNAPPFGTVFLKALFSLLFWIMFGLFYFTLSIRNSFVHISLCRCKLFAVSKKFRWQMNRINILSFFFV